MADVLPQNIPYFPKFELALIYDQYLTFLSYPLHSKNLIVHKNMTWAQPFLTLPSVAHELRNKIFGNDWFSLHTKVWQECKMADVFPKFYKILTGNYLRPMSYILKLSCSFDKFGSTKKYDVGSTIFYSPECYT